MKKIYQSIRNIYGAPVVTAAVLILVACLIQAPWDRAYASADDNISVAFFAGGCFWCMESDFEKLPGVINVVSGYSGGTGAYPTYKNYGAQGHIEVIKVIYDKRKIDYRRLLNHFWTHVDPLDAGGQFCDRGHEYISAIFFRNQEEKTLAEVSKTKVEKLLGKKVKTLLIKYAGFWKAEEYHQDYYKKNTVRYTYYRYRCGRDRRVGALWDGKRLQ